jgi:hypothetical protein
MLLMKKSKPPLKKADPPGRQAEGGAPFGRSRDLVQ